MCRWICREAPIFLLLVSLSILFGAVYPATAVAADIELEVEPPRVVQVYPSHGMEYVPVGTSIHIIFNGPMDESSTIQSVVISPSPDLAYPASWQLLRGESILIITPSRPLKYSTTYKVTVQRGAKNKEGKESLQDYEWVFTTEQSPPSPGEVPKNGGFSTGDISEWEWTHSEERGSRAAQWNVVSDTDGEYVLTISRPPTFEMGSSSLKQIIDREVPLSGLVFLSFDVLIGDYTLKQYSPGGTYPLKVIVVYLDRDGKEHSFTRSYYYHMPVEGGIDSFAEFVEAGKWAHKSYNLSAQTPRPSFIKSIEFESCGWAWFCALDNIKFVW
ncbi:MAG: Ig-like domain-containing protein [Firmicutes bacterium]|jgi:hypothetical protein|nr:Ig-like domain-containing protein [Bacillota bacterium]